MANQTTPAIQIKDSNVGIGTVSPTGKLHTILPSYTSEDTDSQQAIFGSGTSGNGVRIGYSESGNSGYINSIKPGVAWSQMNIGGNNIILNTIGSERMRITAAGNVSIGNTNDTYKLDVTGAARFTGQVNSETLFYVVAAPPAINGGLITVRDTVTATNVTSFAGVFFNSSPGSDYSIGKLTENGTGYLQIRNANSGAELLRMTASGITTFSNLAGIGSRIVVADANGTLSASSALSGYISGSGTTNYLPKFTSASAIGNSTIYDDGTNVGIGTTTPNPFSWASKTLTVASSATNSYAALEAYGNGTGAGAVLLGNTSILRASIVANDGSNLVFAVNASNTGSSQTERMRITASGYIGVASSSPVTRFTVNTYAGSRLPYINGTANTFDANGITVTSSNTANANIGGGLDLTNNVHSIGSYSPLISFSALTQSGTYNNNYAAIYGILAGDSGDGNWNTGHIAFATTTAYGASEKVRITSAGNVGIGTTTPSYKLQVNGAEAGLYVNGAEVAPYTQKIAVFRYGGNGNSVNIENQAGKAAIQGRVDSGAVMDLLLNAAGGNVGIGTGAPDRGLTINRYNEFAALNIIKGNTTNQIVYLGTDNSGADDGGILQLYDAAVEKVRLHTRGNSWINGGNVGIGTTSPENKLHVYGSEPFVRISNSSAANSGIKISYGNSDTHGLHLIYNPGSAISYIDNTHPIYSGQVYGDIYFRQNVGGTMTSRMMIKADGGNVGIGTTSPSEMLEVNGNVQIGSSVDAKLYMVSSGGNGYNERFFIEGYADGGTYGGGFKLSTRNDSNIFNTAVTVNRNGLVGIGTTNPINKLQIGSVPGYSNNAFAIGNGTDQFAIFQASSYTQLYTNGGFLFATNSAEAMRITPGGNLLVGTTTNLGADINANSSIRVGVAFGTKASITLGDSGTPYWEIFRPASSGNLRISSYALNAVEIQPTTGNVGIGTTSPSTKLHVEAGTVFVKSNVNNGSAILTIRSSDDYGYTFARSNTTGFLEFDGNQTGAIGYIFKNGNVGIGTTNPYGRLHLTGDYNGAQNTLNLENNWPNTYNTSLINFWAYYNTSNPQAVIEAGQDVSATNAGVIAFKTMTSGAAPSTKMIIKPSGNVGIGTTNPSSILHIDGVDPYLRINNPSSANNQGIKISYGYSDTHGFHLTYNANAAGAYIDNTYPITSGQPWGDIYFRQNVGGTITSRMMIKADGGNVGIGTTTPGRKLTVQGADDGTMQLRLMGSASQTSYWEIGREAMSTGQFRFIASRNGTVITPMVIDDQNGNVGIGTTSPAAKLQINYTSGNAGLLVTGPIGDTWFPYTNGINYIRGELIVGDIGSTNVQLVTGGGNVGIGTGSPSAIIHSNTSSNVTFLGQSSSGSNTSYAYFQNAGSSNAYQVGFGSNNNDGILVAGGSERLRITSGGNVGIGTTTPNEKLSVAGTMESLATSSIEGGQITLRAGGAYSYRFSIDNYADSFRIIREDDPNSANGYVPFFMDQVGTVGLNTQSPARSAILDLTATNRGFLPPRMTNTQMNNIASPAEGLIVYDTTNKKVTVYNGSSWVPLH